MSEAPRYFIASTTEVQPPVSLEQQLTHMGISPSVSAAYDLLTDDGMSSDKAAGLALAAERSGGRDPEAFARHLIKLRKAMR